MDFPAIRFQALLNVIPAAFCAWLHHLGGKCSLDSLSGVLPTNINFSTLFSSSPYGAKICEYFLQTYKYNPCFYLQLCNMKMLIRLVIYKMRNIRRQHHILKVFNFSLSNFRMVYVSTPNSKMKNSRVLSSLTLGFLIIFLFRHILVRLAMAFLAIQICLQITALPPPWSLNVDSWYKIFDSRQLLKDGCLCE